ncbi:hypothetical protein, partial [uncultured Oscillibacter sp.]|uniref:hypothetical protein n=1 Tax=uncultured Oscillibacter sp. TaxID=876091 RepID=UPI0026333C5B
KARNSSPNMALYWSFLLPSFVCLAFTGFNQCFPKYKRHVNFSDAVFAYCAFLRCAAPDPLLLLRRKLLPFRPSRMFPRPKITGNRISSCYASAR